jgi:1A family penicillin-binding protein
MDLRHRVHLAILLLLAALLGGAALFARWLGPLPDLSALEGRAASPSTLILDRHGRLLYEVADPKRGKHTPIPLARVPLACRQATLATEDAAFYSHPGVDAWAVLRALWQNLRAGQTVSGASTLTQQLARNLLLSPEERGQRTLRRKLREALLALALELRYSKDDLLALYLNQTYYGHFAVGLEAAAQAYFGKSAAELGLAECALLAGLPQWPAGYNPLENPEAARQRQATVLGLMVKHGYLSAEDAARAAREPLRFAATPFPIRAPHFVMYVLGLLEEELGRERLAQGGLRVYTTLDLGWQETAEDIIRYRLRQLAEDPNAPRERRVENAALVALDPYTGHILAMVGSPDYFNPRISGAVNAALALRQPGSAIKPITYAAAFDPERAARRGQQPYTPATMVADVRTAFPTREGTPYVPRNYDLEYHGPVLLRQALAASLNIPAVKVLQFVGLEDFVAQAQRLGLRTLEDPNRYGLALTLGGGEVRLLDLTAAYAAFANGGRQVVPMAILRVEDAQGRVVRTWEPRLGPQAVSPQVAYLITDILSDNQARAAAFGEASPLYLGFPAAAKTGTTTDWRDNWTLGYTPDLAVGVWVGNADNAEMLGVSGIAGAAPIWRDFMLAVRRGGRAFPRPEGLVEVEVCADTGLLPNDLCPRRRELFIAGTEPTTRDETYRVVVIDAATGELATESTPSGRRVVRVARLLPADLHEWARQHGILLAADVGAPITGGAGKIAGRAETGAALVLTSPDPNAAFRLSPTLPADVQRLEVAARPGDGIALKRLTLLADGVPLAEFTGPPYRAWWPLQEGRHEFRAVGLTQDGREVVSATVAITVER